MNPKQGITPRCARCDGPFPCSSPDCPENIEWDPFDQPMLPAEGVGCLILFFILLTLAALNVN